MISAKGEKLDITSSFDNIRPVSYTHLDVYKRQVYLQVLRQAVYQMKVL